MCGFAGLINLRGNSLSSRGFNANKMLDPIIQRGPDFKGEWSEGCVWFGHCRLAIHDLTDSGIQPMESECGRYIIVFNGEIYNFKLLMKELDNNVKCWKGSSDTEVLINAIAIWGIEKTLEQLNGMFAFAVWDRFEQSLFLARDRMGEKPLYFSHQKGNFSFGSELTCIESIPGFEKTICRDALQNYFDCGYFQSPLTIYKDVFKLPPGHYLFWKKGQEYSIKEYWSVNKIAIQQSSVGLITDKDIALNNLEALLVDSISLRMKSDVPLGSFLSGGIDSSIVTALLQRLSGKPVNTFSIGFNTDGFNEAKHAKKIANYLGTNHCEQYVSTKEMLDTVSSLHKLHDEPYSDSSIIPTYIVSKLAREKVTVCLSGDGGDELFGGYRRYQMTIDLWKKIQWLPTSIRSLFSYLIQASPPYLLTHLFRFMDYFASQYSRSHGNLGLKIKKLSQWIDAKSFDDLYISIIRHCPMNSLVVSADDAYSCVIPELGSSQLSSLAKMSLHDTTHYLPGDILTKVDRATMAVSLEGRMPLLDHRIVELAYSISDDLKIRNGTSKWLLKELLYRYIPKEMVDRP